MHIHVLINDYVCCRLFISILGAGGTCQTNLGKLSCNTVANCTWQNSTAQCLYSGEVLVSDGVSYKTRPGQQGCKNSSSTICQVANTLKEAEVYCQGLNTTSACYSEDSGDWCLWSTDQSACDVSFLATLKSFRAAGSSMANDYLAHRDKCRSNNNVVNRENKCKSVPLPYEESPPPPAFSLKPPSPNTSPPPPTTSSPPTKPSPPTNDIRSPQWPRAATIAVVVCAAVLAAL